MVITGHDVLRLAFCSVYFKLKATSQLIFLQVNLFILQDYIISSAYNRIYINSDQVTKQRLMCSFPSCKTQHGTGSKGLSKKCLQTT